MTILYYPCDDNSHGHLEQSVPVPVLSRRSCNKHPSRLPLALSIGLAKHLHCQVLHQEREAWDTFKLRVDPSFLYANLDHLTE